MVLPQPEKRTPHGTRIQGGAGGAWVEEESREERGGEEMTVRPRSEEKRSLLIILTCLGRALSQNGYRGSGSGLRPVESRPAPRIRAGQSQHCHMDTSRHCDSRSAKH